MRRLLLFLMAFALGGTLTLAVYASPPSTPIKLIVNGQEILPDVPPQLINGRVMVPARFVAEPLGAKVEWDGAGNAVVIAKSASPSDDTTLTTNYTTLSITLNNRTEDAPAVIKDGVPCLPLPAIIRIIDAKGQYIEHIAPLKIQCNNTKFEFFEDNLKLAKIDDQNVILKTSVHRKESGLSGYALFLPIDVFTEYGCFRYALDGNTLHIH